MDTGLTSLTTQRKKLLVLIGSFHIKIGCFVDKSLLVEHINQL